ncbi:MAG: hypothetical protein J5940_07195, partial [Clostridia bacterium]|nr:hypothetical protein [Clostridia bacterium]
DFDNTLSFQKGTVISMGINLDRKELAKQAFEECSSAETTVRYGVKRVRPFWNAESTQFMYVPAFHFTAIRGCRRYRYTAKDEKGGVHSFEANDCCALLTPIWRELPEGVVGLTVTALDNAGNEFAVVGARTFFRLAPFPEETPPAVRSYRESAVKAYRYVMSQGFVRHWLEHGEPDPYYDLNVYPSKMISALVNAMIAYAKICPGESSDAMRVAVKAADHLIRITPRGDAPLADLPPTYYLDFCPDPKQYGVYTPNWRAAEARVGTVMMIYPASAGLMYLNLEKATGDAKYLEEAVRIGRYYLKTVEPNGSWRLVRSCRTGEPVTGNCVAPIEAVVPFLAELYSRTGDECWRGLRDGAGKYVTDTQLASYNWEAQFEDSALSTDYFNLTHYAPVALASYLAENGAGGGSLELAKELMRFAEDQFVVWKRPSPWCHGSPDGDTPYDTSIWHTPAVLEQYRWYVPIDASTSFVALGFLSLYKAGCGDIYLAKARALTDQLTRVQRDDGKIPTHWMNTPEAEANFWFNCMLESCRTLSVMSEYE